MDICFYRETGIFAALIRWWTDSPWAHVEFRFTNGTHWGAISSSGTSWLSVRSPDKVVPVTCFAWQEDDLREWCTKETECPYDWKGIFLAQFLNRARSTKDAWFCSEVVVAGLQHIDKLPDWIRPCTISPGALYNILTGVESGVPK